tara:strand:- start:186 stop:356 length:171 start_codon:yes stop_codon:yes gene_type:complete
MGLTAFILLEDKVGLLVVHTQALGLAVATSVVEVVATKAPHTFKGQQAGLGILIPL